MAETALVASPPRQGNQSIPHLTNFDTEDGTQKSNPIIPLQKVPFLYHLDFMWDVYNTKHGFDLVDELSKPYRLTSNKLYEFRWRHLQCWLTGNNFPQIRTETI